MSPMDTDLEARLRRDLRARQHDVPPAPADLADRVRRRHRSQRRTQALTLVAAAAVAAVVAGGSSLVSSPEARSAADTAEEGRPVIEPTILERPTRGSLADDPEWLAAVRRLDWQVPTELFGEIPDPPADERHVAFAGDVPGGRVALVVGEDDGQLGGAWFTGPAGAEPEDMALAASPQRVNRHGPLALLQTDDQYAREGVLVVVTTPEESVDLMAPPVVAADGTETRSRIELPVDDGIVVTGIDGAWFLGRELRTSDGTGRPYVVGPTIVHPQTRGSAVPVVPSGAPSEQAMLDDLVAGLLAQYGLTADEARPIVLARGTGRDGERIGLIGLTFPSGATGAWLMTVETTADGWGGSVSRLPHAAAGTPLEERLVSVPVDGYRLALHGPEQAVRAEVLTEDGRVLGAVPLEDGAFVGQVPGGAFAPSTDGAASLRLLDPAGGVVAEGPIGRVVVE